MLKKKDGLWGVRWSIHHLERKWSWSLRQKIVNASVKLPTSVTLRLPNKVHLSRSLRNRMGAWIGGRDDGVHYLTCAK